MRQTVIYVRQSLGSNKQKYSIEVQLSNCKEYALKKGWVVHNVFDEGQCSTRKTTIKKRPKLTELLSSVRAGTIGRIIVFKRDRLARNVEQYLTLLSEIVQANAELHFAADNEPPIFHGPIGEFVESLLAGVAEQEGENIYRRQLNSRIQLSKKGKWMSGTPHYGYQSHNGTLTQIPEKVELVKTVYEEFIHCNGETFDDVAKKMKKNPALKSKGLDVKKIIPLPIYKGRLIQRFEGKAYEFPEVMDDLRVVSDVDWERANHKLLTFGPFIENTEGDKDRERALLATLITCGRCHTPLKAGTKNYSCPNCSSNKVSYHILDECVIKNVIDHLERVALEHKTEVADFLKHRFIRGPQKRMGRLEKELQRTESDIKKWMEHYAPRKANDAYIRELIQSFRARLLEYEITQSTVLRIQDTIDLFLKATSNKLTSDGLTYGDKRLLVSLVHSVELYKSNITIKVVK